MSGCVERVTVGEVLTLCVLALLGVGVLAVESAAQEVTTAEALDVLRMSRVGARHALFAALAAMLYWAGARLPPGWAGKHWVGAAAVTLAAAALALALVPGIGVSVNGASRWLPVGGGVVVQASEIAKWAGVVWLAGRCGEIGTFRGFAVTAAPVALLCLLTVIEDFGTAALIALAAGATLFGAGAKLGHLLAVAVPAAGAGWLFVAGTPYRWARLTGFLDPWADPEGGGFHMVQALLAFGGGGVTGTGLGLGVQKLGYLPEDTTDFVFAAWCEETGAAGAAAVVALYLGVILAGGRAVRREELPPAARVLGLGVAVTVALQAATNVAVATVSVPTKGMSLPLVSAGGSGLLMTALMLGLLRAALAPHPPPRAA